MGLAMSLPGTTTRTVPLRILHLEDNVHDAELVQAALEAGGLRCIIERVETEYAFRKALDADFQLIISDYSLPSFNGKKALAIAREHRPDIPFIFVSGTIGEESAIESLLAGATDYVLKHKFGRLIPAVRRAIHEAEERRARREAERQLETTVEQLRNLFENLDEVFFSIDSRSGTLLQISPACERVYGLPPQAFFENPHFWKQAVNSDDLPALRSAQSSIEAGRAASFENRIQRADGALRWVQVKLKPVQDPAGNIIRIDGIISDVTERKDLEAQFLRAQRMENLGSLAGGIAHDLNNVLAPIVMAVSLLREEHQDAKTRGTLTLVDQCARRGANLVKQILMFARGVQGRRSEINAGRLIGEFENMLRRTLPKSIDIAVRVPPDLWSVSADKTQFEQVLMNLCVNARDAMAGGGRLTIAARNEPFTPREQSGDAAAPGHVAIEITDTGSGISSENLEKIFDPFFTTKEAGTGTGLGLSTVHAIVRNHGGAVSVESALNQGTTFTVRLPALGAGAPKELDIKSSSFPSGQGELILVVDDEAAIRDLARTILENCGYRVLVAADGFEGVTVFAENRDGVNLVLTDLDMPRMSGAEMIRRIQEIKGNVRVISASGLMEGVGFGHVVAGPVRAVLAKPFSPVQLLQNVRDALDAG